jgi:arylsulfatase A-like enzyme
MPKDSALALRAFFSLFIAIALLDATVLAQPVAKPNIVLIMADDAGYADFGFMNQFTGRTTPFKTPRLDQLAAESVKFSNAYVPSSICAVTRAGIMTGRQPDSFGFSYNALPEDLPYEGLPVSEKTILERVKELGYSTGVIGKWHLGEQPQWVPTARGADYFFGIYEGHINYYPNPTSATQIRRGTEIVQWASEPSFNNIAPDPTRGRYLTDALGDEASQFISQKAAAAEPFLLYAALNAPHTPYDTKAQDYAQFPSLTGQRRAVAAMTLSMDRAIGNIMDRINDPNGDGDQSDSIADNTVIIFLNDNGGPNSAYDNGPLAGTKGSAWEGGIRTPMLVKAPNVAPGVFDNVVSGLDLFSTIEGLARSPTMTPAYGKDLMPFLRGEQTGVVHEALVTRNRGNFAAVRVGAWKLVKPDASTTWKLFHLNTDGSGEDVDLQLQYPEIVEALTKEYVKVDVTLDKPRNSGPAKVRNYDLFIRRNDLGATNYWTDTNSWLNGENPSVVTGISRDEPCPNFKVAFTVNSASDYRSINNANRSSGLTRAQLAQGLKDLPGLGEVMLNEIRLQGNFAGNDQP